MTQKQTDAADVTLDLLAIQSNALEAIRDYSRYLRNAENAGLPEVAYFVHLLMEEDSARAAHCQGLLRSWAARGATGRHLSLPSIGSDLPSRWLRTLGGSPVRRLPV